MATKLTDEQKAKFADLYNDYTSKNPKFSGPYQCNIRETCALARTLANAPYGINGSNVDVLVRQQANGIADVRQGVIPHRVETSSFYPVVTAMLCKSSTNQSISNSQYDAYKEALFNAAEYRANLVFNRLAFAIFPIQFCAVVSEERLRNVCLFLKEKGVVDFGTISLAELNWFDLCEIIVPKVKEAFPEKDYADHSVFLAAIGEVEFGGTP